jgi:serine protease Do
LVLLAAVCVGAAAAPLRADPALLRAEELAFKQAVALAEPSIVRIETVGGLDLVGELLTGAGPTTGVIVSEDGYIITSSFNFVSKPAGIVVTLPNGRRFPAQVAASDQARMLTLLKIDVAQEPTRLTPLPAAPREGLCVGQWAIALGRVYDLAVPNVSVGILSAVNRVWGRAVQTDAKVSPANYGGPLIDLEGRGIGILVPLSPQKTDETAGVEWYDGGIGFAIPLEDVYAVLDRLKAGETLKPGLLGVTFPDMSVLAGEARIDRVRPESPADRSGLRVGDVVIAANGQPVQRVPDLRHILGRLYAGDIVHLTIQRGDATFEADVELAGELLPYESGYLGILPARRAQEAAPEGVEIREVLPRSPAALAGLARRDVIVSCDGRPTPSPADLLDVIGRRRPGETVSLRYRRDGVEASADMTLAAVSDDVPDDLPAANIPAPPEGAVPAAAVGRANAALPGEGGASYWRYVPAHYNPAYAYGLVVWLHPAGDVMEAAMLRLWREHCDRRGLILVAPRAGDLSGWTPGESEIVRQIVEQVQQEYTIDPARICLHGHAEGGRFAWSTAFKHRELFRGVVASAAPLREPPPDNDPDFRTQLCLVVGQDDPLRPRVERSGEILRSMKYPTRLIVVPELGEAYPPAEVVDQLARWIDLLDRI